MNVEIERQIDNLLDQWDRADLYTTSELIACARATITLLVTVIGELLRVETKLSRAEGLLRYYDISQVVEYFQSDPDALPLGREPWRLRIEQLEKEVTRLNGIINGNVDLRTG